MEILISDTINMRVLRSHSIYVKLVPEILVVVEVTQQMNL